MESEHKQERERQVKSIHCHAAADDDNNEAKAEKSIECHAISMHTVTSISSIFGLT